MIYEFRKVTLIKTRKPQKKDLNTDLQWFSESLGLFNQRDKERSCFRIFVELVKSARRKQLLSSDELADKTNLTRGTIIHHITHLIESGLVTQYENKYMLRVENLETLIEELQRDLGRVFEDLKDMAQELDDQLGLIKRDKKSSKVISD
ncbi:MAG: winged helix-turn-helix transcriptional regulator [Nanoarchaeota archaeon]